MFEGYQWPILFKLTLLAMGEILKLPHASEVTLKDMGKINQHHTITQQQGSCVWSLGSAVDLTYSVSFLLYFLFHRKPETLYNNVV